MNIFAVDDDPKVAAQSLVDSHVVKMILESAQMLSTAHRVLDGEKVGKKWILNDGRDSVLYSATHINHPSSVWIRQSVGNYDWLYDHFIYLGDEYTHRYGKVHKSITNLATQLCVPPVDLIAKGGVRIEFALAMPDEYKVTSDPVQSYRNYYRGAKKHLHKWTKREMPEWMK